MARKVYPSDISNAEWQIIESLLPEAQSIGRPGEVDFRDSREFFTSCTRDVHGVRYRMIYRRGQLSITIFGSGRG